MKIFGTILFVVILLQLFFPNPAKAQVVINEVNPSGEWIELFKSSVGAISLEGCILYFHSLESSSSNTQKKLLTINDNFLEDEEYKVITSGGSWLSNSSSDTVLLDCLMFDDGPYTYGDNLDTKSFVRVPNGTGSFVVLSESTQGSVNPSPTPEPTLIPTTTPSPAPTSTPTSTPTATKTPTPTPTKTSMPTPTPTKTSVPTPTKIPTSTPKQSPIERVDEQIPSDSGSVLGIKEASSGSILNSKQNTPIVLEKKNSIIAIILIGLGLILIGGSVYWTLKTSKSSSLKNDI